MSTIPTVAMTPGPMGLNQLPCHVRATVVSVGGAGASREYDELVLRLLEIGFLPGEPVRVVAHGFPGREPMAVRLGRTTFALRRHEAALVRVAPEGAAPAAVEAAR